MNKTVMLGMSGGVDSSVAAILLKEQGYNVVGIFMKNWDEKIDREMCSSAKDYEDASKVAAQLDIPLYSVNFVKKYWDEVFQYFLDEYKKGRTPNPDVLCNQNIKFKAFLDYSLDLSADYIAMGHYARVEKDNISGKYKLLKGLDDNKDQSYFLSRISQEALSKTIFPIGDLTKQDIRNIAQKYNLATANKKDSTGICFIGERNFNEFIDNYLPAQSGDIVDIDSGKVVGKHSGLMHYTLGQRRGIGIGGMKGEVDEPYFVVDKDLSKNYLYVGRGEDNSKLYSDYLVSTDPIWIADEPKFPIKCNAKFRYRQKDIPVEVFKNEDCSLKIVYDNPVKAVTPGQVAVLYDGDICLGGSFIDRTFSENQ